jgi:sec-independent protein translocase protein TatB
MFGLTLEKLLLIAVIAAFILGPERLPHYAEKLGEFVRSLRALADTAHARVAEELGPEFDRDEWKKLDPRQYDPRRIVRDALADGSDAAPTAPSLPPAAVAPRPARAVAAGGWQEAMLARVGPAAERGREG